MFCCKFIADNVIPINENEWICEILHNPKKYSDIVADLSEVFAIKNQGQSPEIIFNALSKNAYLKIPRSNFGDKSEELIIKELDVNYSKYYLAKTGQSKTFDESKIFIQDDSIYIEMLKNIRFLPRLQQGKVAQLLNEKIDAILGRNTKRTLFLYGNEAEFTNWTEDRTKYFEQFIKKYEGKNCAWVYVVDEKKNGNLDLFNDNTGLKVKRALTQNGQCFLDNRLYISQNNFKWTESVQ